MSRIGASRSRRRTFWTARDGVTYGQGRGETWTGVSESLPPLLTDISPDNFNKHICAQSKQGLLL